MKAVLYARVSSKEQEKEGFSIPAQQNLLREYARKLKIQVACEFTDVETAKAAGRTQFGKMIEFLAVNQTIKIILVEKTDRLYRNFRDYVLLEDLGLEIHLVKENDVISKDSRSHTKFIHGIKVLMAKNYIDNLSEEVKKGMCEKAEQGDYPSKAPLGYKNNLLTHRIEVNPETAILVRKLFEWYATGKFSLKTVADKAYREGLGYRKSGMKFSPGTMEKILKNPIYYGYFRWAGKLLKGSHEPLITKELFDQVQYQTGRFDKPKPTKHDFPFRGLLTCGYCGCAMTAEIHKGRYIYYRCTGGKGKCDQAHIRQEEVARLLGLAVQRISIDAEIAEWIKGALRASHGDEILFHKQAIDDLNRERTKLENRISQIYIDKIDGVISEQDWQTLHGKFAVELECIQAKLGNHTRANLDYIEKGVLILELAQDAYSQYVNQNDYEKRKLLDFVLSNCLVRGNEFAPVYRQPFDLLADYKARDVKKIRRSDEKSPSYQLWRPQGDSNPCYRRERAVS